MRSFLAKVAEHSIPLFIVVVLMGGSAVAGGLINGGQIQNGSITGRDVKDRSLKPRDFSGAVRGPAGQAGANGQAGAPGLPGPAANGTELVQASSESDNVGTKEQIAVCPNGPVISGGYVLSINNGKRVVRSYPVDDHSWLVRAVDEVPNTPWQLTAFAICST